VAELDVITRGSRATDLSVCLQPSTSRPWSCTPTGDRMNGFRLDLALSRRRVRVGRRQNRTAWADGLSRHRLGPRVCVYHAATTHG